MNLKMLGMLLVVAAVGAVPAMGQQEATVIVNITEYAYDPPVLNVAAGTTVVWTNLGQVPHDVQAFLKTPAGAVPTGTGTFGAMLEPGQSFAYTFSGPGVYIVNCNLGSLHNQMKQVVVVN